MDEIKLHLGCGKRNFGDDWVHIDAANFPHIKWNDVTRLRYEDATVDVIYASHLIAYFSREEIIPLLQSWHRVLKVGGVLRLATPDFGKLAEMYWVHGFERVAGPLYGQMEVNGKQVYHKTCYDIFDLTEVLLSAGFKGVDKYDHTKTEHPNTGDRNDKYDDHSSAYINGQLISLNVQCVK